MIKRKIIISAIAATLLALSGNAVAEDQQQVYGSQLMTQQERLEHHERMRNAKTAEERHQIQKEHHEMMQERAKARGQKLREMSDERREGQGRGAGMGEGAGSGKGSGGGGR